MPLMSLNIQGIGHKEKKKWVRNLCTTHNLNFLSIQETKKETFSSSAVRALWGNSYFYFNMASHIFISLWLLGAQVVFYAYWELIFLFLYGYWELRWYSMHMGQRFIL